MGGGISLTQNIYSHEALSPSEISAEGVNGLRRLQWAL
jgi:hypothetical protein